MDFLFGDGVGQVRLLSPDFLQRPAIGQNFGLGERMSREGRDAFRIAVKIRGEDKLHPGSVSPPKITGA